MEAAYIFQFLFKHVYRSNMMRFLKNHPSYTKLFMAHTKKDSTLSKIISLLCEICKKKLFQKYHTYLNYVSHKHKNLEIGC